MAALTNTQISVTYVGLLKTSASTVLSSTAQQMTDGAGNNSILYLSTAEVGIGGSPTAGKELDVTGNVLITGDLQIDNINIDGNTISATSGVVTLQDGTIATTQSQNDNSTKIATTAYVDAAIDGVDTLAEILANGNTTGGTDIEVSSGDNIDFADGSLARFGASNDLKLQHNGTNSFIDNETGALFIRQKADDSDIIFQSDDGSGGLASYITMDGSDVITKIHKNFRYLDNVKANFGNSDDLQIYHDSNNSKIQEGGTGSLVLDTNGPSILLTKSDTEFLAKFITDGAVELYYDNSKKFETTSTGVSVAGTVSLDNQLHIEQAKSGSSAENYDLIRLNLTGTGAIGDSSSIVWYSTSGTKTAGIEGVSGQDNILYGEIVFNVRKYTTDSFDEALRINNRGNTIHSGNVEVNGTLIDLDSSASATVAIDRGATSNVSTVSWRNAGSEYFRAGLEYTDSNLWSLLHTCGNGLYFEGNNMRFGIGTSTPQKTLHIEGAGGASESQLLITGASDTVGHTAGILLRAEAGEGDSSLRAKGAIFF